MGFGYNNNSNILQAGVQLFILGKVKCKTADDQGAMWTKHFFHSPYQVHVLFGLQQTNAMMYHQLICCCFLSGYCPHKLIAGHCFDNSPFIWLCANDIGGAFVSCKPQLHLICPAEKWKQLFSTHGLTGLIKYMGSQVIYIYRINAFVSCKPNHHTGSKVETTVSTHGLALDPRKTLSVAQCAPNDHRGTLFIRRLYPSVTSSNGIPYDGMPWYDQLTIALTLQPAYIVQQGPSVPFSLKCSLNGSQINGFQIKWCGNASCNMRTVCIVLLDKFNPSKTRKLISYDKIPWYKNWLLTNAYCGLYLGPSLTGTKWGMCW